jgi:hypothetical protein
MTWGRSWLTRLVTEEITGSSIVKFVIERGRVITMKRKPEKDHKFIFRQ